MASPSLMGVENERIVQRVPDPQHRDHSVGTELAPGTMTADQLDSEILPGGINALQPESARLKE
jgi:hypothetical protein